MVEQVEIFNYLGTEIDHHPSFTQHAEQMNTFYARFNRTDPVEDCPPTSTRYAPAPIRVEERKVVSILSQLHLTKLLDRMTGCAAQLGCVAAAVPERQLGPQGL
ncbi:unnamed protein product [Merluccius merluccius]